MNEVSTGVYVISLDSSIDRRTAFTELSHQSNLPWAFFPAHRKLESPLVYDERLAIRRFGRPLSPAEIGTYTSHWKTWERFLESGLDQLIVLEDDVIADWALLNLLGAFRFEDTGIDFLRLFATHPFKSKTSAFRFCSPHSHLVRCTGLVLGIQAYLLTKKGALALLGTGNKIFEPVDWVMSRYWKYRIPNYSLFPFPVIERFVPSTIGASREATYSVTSSERLSSLVWRIKNRISREFADRLLYGRNAFSGSVDVGSSYIERERARSKHRPQNP